MYVCAKWQSVHCYFAVIVYMEEKSKLSVSFVLCEIFVSDHDVSKKKKKNSIDNFIFILNLRIFWLQRI